MKEFVNILKQFTQSQRLIVLVLLLTFTFGSYSLSVYLKTDDCRSLMEENIKMHEDFVTISKMLREERMRDKIIVSDTVSIGGRESFTTIPSDNTLMDSILHIADSNNQ